MSEFYEKRNCRMEDGQEVCEFSKKMSFGSKGLKWEFIMLAAFWACICSISFIIGWASTSDVIIGLKYLGYTGAISAMMLVFACPYFGIAWIWMFLGISNNLLLDLSLTMGTWLGFVLNLYWIIGIVISIVMSVFVTFMIVMWVRVLK